MTLAAGARLGPYEIQAALGAGGMGEVYRARDTRLDRTVAIKVLPEALAGDPQFRERFGREARAISSLNHPHICTLHDVGRQDSSTGSGQAVDYLVMEYLEGETLADRIARDGGPQGPPLRVDEALQIAIQIADALATAHRAGVIHRDLKPGNIFLVGRRGSSTDARRGGPSGEVCGGGPSASAAASADSPEPWRRRSDPPVAKLLDFGLAKSAAPAVSGAGLSMLPTTPHALTGQGTILGTFQYMAPEQLEGGEADARTDIFAFGAVLYEMLTGRKAFEGKSHASLIGAIMHAEPAPVLSVQPLTPRSVDRLVRKCLAKDPDDRWQTARDLLDELKWTVEAGAPEGTAMPVAGPRPARFGSARLAWGVAAISLVVAALAVTTSYFWRPVPEPVVTRLDLVTPPTSDAFSFALSPDGRQLAFVANGEKGSQLWLRPLDQATAQALAGTEGASFPFWAPDNRAVGFFADGKLKRANVGGGPPQVLADAPTARGGAWNRDGVIVFGQASPGALMRVMASGGTPSPVTQVTAGQNNHRWPQFLPDGRRILFFVPSGDPQVRGVYVASLDGGELTRIVESQTAAVYAPGRLLRVSQGVLVSQPFDAAHAALAGEPIPVAQDVGVDDGLFRSAVSVSALGVLAHRSGVGSGRQLVFLDRTGKLLGNIGPQDESSFASPALASDGGRVAVGRIVQGNADVWLIDVGRAVMSRFTFEGGPDRQPIWSPDGNRIVFQSTRNGVLDLFEKPANGAADEQPLIVSPEPKNPLDWSSDGRVLLYASLDSKTQSDLWAVSLTGDRKPVPVVRTSFDDVQGQFSSDGRWLAYASNESGRYEIYVQAFPDPGGKWQVSTAGGVYPRWRRDGRELYYIDPDNRLTAVPILVTANARTVDAGAPVALFSTRLAVGANIFTTGFNSRAQYAVAADGRFLMDVQADDAVASPITVVLNWEAGLGR